MSAVGLTHTRCFGSRRPCFTVACGGVRRRGQFLGRRLRVELHGRSPSDPIRAASARTLKSPHRGRSEAEERPCTWPLDEGSTVQPLGPGLERTGGRRCVWQPTRRAKTARGLRRRGSGSDPPMVSRPVRETPARRKRTQRCIATKKCRMIWHGDKKQDKVS